jgi:hypothetical protein
MTARLTPSQRHHGAVAPVATAGFADEFIGVTRIVLPDAHADADVDAYADA